MVTPVVRYMLLCDDARPDPQKPSCINIECLLGNIVALDDPAFPLLREKMCVYLVLTECYGAGVVQIRVAFSDSEPEQLLFGSPEHDLDFSGHSPLELLGVVFRLKDCLFPRAGLYSVQLWYNGAKIEERPLRLKASGGSQI